MKLYVSKLTIKNIISEDNYIDTKFTILKLSLTTSEKAINRRLLTNKIDKNINGYLLRMLSILE